MTMIAAFLMVTIDGFHGGPNGEFDFWDLDDAFHEFSAAQLDNADALLFGRGTYQGMADYRTSPDAADQSPELAKRMDELPKIVASATLTTAEWTPSTIIEDLANLTGGSRTWHEPTLVLGSPTLVSNLINLGVLDELRIMINATALGSGRSPPPAAAFKTL